jgi:hypothetical protein
MPPDYYGYNTRVIYYSLSLLSIAILGVNKGLDKIIDSILAFYID